MGELEEAIGKGAERKNAPSVKPGNMMEVKCARCEKPCHLTVPEIELVNVESYSAYHFPHEHMESCEHCGQPYLFRLGPIGRMGMTMSFFPVRQKPSISVVPGNAVTDRELKNPRIIP